MEKEQIDNIRSFADSDFESKAENQFTEKELKAYFDKKRQLQYAEKLDQQFGIRKQNANSETSGKMPGSTLKYIFLALIGILLAFTIYYFFIGTKKSDSDIMMAYKNELYTPVDVNVRGNLNDYQLSISKLTEAYEKKDFDTVIKEYQTLKNSSAPFDLNIEQMSGIAFASLEQYDEAITIFTGILNTKESSYSNHTTVRYLLGLVYLLNEDKPNAVQMLQQIKSGDYKYQEAQRLIETL